MAQPAAAGGGLLDMTLHAGASAADVSMGEAEEPLQCWVTVFGFDPAHTTQVLSLMQPSNGSIVQQRGGYLNWMHVQYSSRLQAQGLIAGTLGHGQHNRPSGIGTSTHKICKALHASAM